MATNLAIDTQAVEELMRLGGFTSKREAVDQAVKEAISFRRQMHVANILGTVDFDPVMLPGHTSEAQEADTDA